MASQGSCVCASCCIFRASCHIISSPLQRMGSHQCTPDCPGTFPSAMNSIRGVHDMICDQLLASPSRMPLDEMRHYEVTCSYLRDSPRLWRQAIANQCLVLCCLFSQDADGGKMACRIDRATKSLANRAFWPVPSLLLLENPLKILAPRQSYRSTGKPRIRARYCTISRLTNP